MFGLQAHSFLSAGIPNSLTANSKIEDRRVELKLKANISVQQPYCQATVFYGTGCSTPYLSLLFLTTCGFDLSHNIEQKSIVHR